MTPHEQYQRMTETVAHLYQRPLFQRAGVDHPLVVFYPDESQVSDVDSVLDGPPPASDQPEDFGFYNRAFLQDIQNSGRNVFNGVTYAYHLLRERPLRIRARHGRYFDMLATCAALDAELRDTTAAGAQRLPGRIQMHRRYPAADAIVRGDGRSAAIGGANLIVFNHDGQYKAILARRSWRSATDPGFFHLLPAYIFQPTPSRHPQAWSIAYQVCREYLEELFGLDEVHDPQDPHYFQDHPAYVDLQAMIQTGQAGLYLTGVTINLWTLRPEISTLLLIHDRDWYPRITAPDSPIPLQIHAETDDERLTLLPIDDDESLLSALPPQVHTIMPPQATGALWLGVDRARRLISGDELR